MCYLSLFLAAFQDRELLVMIENHQVPKENLSCEFLFNFLGFIDVII